MPQQTVDNIMLHQPISFSNQCWRADALALMDCAYPAHPTVFSHDFVGHPLLESAALIEAAVALPSESVELRGAGAAGTFCPMPVTPQALDEMLAGPTTRNAWLMIRGLEALPAYRDLIDGILGPVATLARKKTGKVHQPRAFLFCASARSLTPYHFDPEHNILFHIRGPKRFSLQPARDPFLSIDDHLRLHEMGENLLGEPIGSEAAAFDLEPGSALYVPYKWPHWVEVGGAPSLSLSVTWTSDWSLARDSAWRAESLFRRLRLRHRPMPDWPKTTPVRSAIGAATGRIL
jgi:Cupin-like domain